MPAPRTGPVQGAESEGLYSRKRMQRHNMAGQSPVKYSSASVTHIASRHTNMDLVQPYAGSSWTGRSHVALYGSAEPEAWLC